MEGKHYLWDLADKRTHAPDKTLGRVDLLAPAELPETVLQYFKGRLLAPFQEFIKLVAFRGGDGGFEDSDDGRTYARLQRKLEFGARGWSMDLSEYIIHSVASVGGLSPDVEVVCRAFLGNTGLLMVTHANEGILAGIGVRDGKLWMPDNEVRLSFASYNNKTVRPPLNHLLTFNGSELVPCEGVTSPEASSDFLVFLQRVLDDPESFNWRAEVPPGLEDSMCLVEG